MEQTLKPYQILNNFQLKLLAILLMLVDHTGLTLFPGQPLFRLIGRLAFPIFCFLLVEGFFHTHNVYLYGLRLAIFALISQIPFNFMIYGWGKYNIYHWNVFVTLFLGLIIMWGCQIIQQRISQLPIAFVLQLLLILLIMLVAALIHCDYGDMGILLIALFYYVRVRNQGSLTLLLFLAVWSIAYGGTELYAVLAAIPLLMYNGEKGRSLKYFFYGFYPVHMLLLSFLVRLSF